MSISHRVMTHEVRLHNCEWHKKPCELLGNKAADTEMTISNEL